MKQSADENFEFDENTRKFSKRVENTVGKGEIVRYEQFLLFLQCFQKACFPGASKGVIVWEWVNPLPYMPVLGSSNSAANENMMSKVWTNGEQLSDCGENIVGKEEIPCSEQFLLFPQCFQKLYVVDALK